MVPVVPLVCLVILVPKVRELTEDGFARQALRSALDIVEGTSQTWSVMAMSDMVQVVVEEAAIFLSLATGSVEGAGAVVSIVKSNNEEVAVFPQVSTSSI